MQRSDFPEAPAINGVDVLMWFDRLEVNAAADLNSQQSRAAVS